jgi:predicted nucleotidyltransferase
MMSRGAPPAQRKPKDRDFIETQEGFLFCVVGYLHPPDKYTAYLKYSPASEGRWRRQGRAYHRELAYYHAHQVGQTLDYLQVHYPHYVHYCPVRDMLFSMVPQDRVQTYYCPEQRLAQILANPKDPLEEEIARLVEAVRDATGISLAHLGVTGSILLGSHDPSFSDIDLTIYGRENTSLLRAALVERGIPGISPLDETFLDGWCREMAEHHGLTYQQMRWLAARRWNFAYYGQGRYISLLPTRSDAEIREAYGDHTYRDAGVTRLQAVISEAAESIFLPAVYGIEKVKILEGPTVQVAEIYAYESLFSQAADVGQAVEAQGKLEELDGGPLHRLVIGSSRRTGVEYLKPVSL